MCKCTYCGSSLSKFVIADGYSGTGLPYRTAFCQRIATVGCYGTSQCSGVFIRTGCCRWRYFDGERFLTGNGTVTAGESSSEDTGDALISTRDGGFILAGSVQTTPNLGKGGKDILLIKIDSQGNILWHKVMGGAGNETVNSIRETADGGLLLCGSNDVSGLSSIFIMKTDANGELNN